MEANAMWLTRLVGKLRSWYHSNDAMYLSEAYQRQRARATVDYYTHVGDPTNG
jgi:hypothetical protein